EAVGVGRLETFDDSPGTRIHDALVEPERREIAVLVERLDGAALLLVTEDPIDLGGKSVANLLGNRPVGGVEGGQGIRRGPPGGGLDPGGGARGWPGLGGCGDCFGVFGSVGRRWRGGGCL